jgi:SsrA-binding protein
MLLVTNKKARHDYQIEDTLLAGVVLTGAEVKSLRLKQASLKGSFVRLVKGEAWLIDAQISPYKFANNSEYDPKRMRKLLLKKRELGRLVGLKEQTGRTIVPLAFKLINNHIKLEIGVGRGLKQHEKREKLKKRADRREAQKVLKAKLKGF